MVGLKDNKFNGIHYLRLTKLITIMSNFSPIRRPTECLDLTDLLESLNSSQEITAHKHRMLLKSGLLTTGKSTNSSKSNRSKYSNNSKLLKSNLF